MGLNKQWANQLVSDLMRDFDIGKEAAIGFVGALAMESKGFTDWQEDKPLAGRGGAGMAQWTGVRRKALERHAKAGGYDDPFSYESQYSYLRAELKGRGKHDGGIMRKLKGVTDTDKAQRLTTTIFLRPSKQHRNNEARASWTNQVAANYKPVPPGNIPEVGSELDVNRPPVPLKKSGTIAAVQLLNSLRGEGEELITSTGVTPKPLPRAAGDQARAKAQNREMREQPGFLGGLLEQAGILEPLSSGVTPLTFEKDIRKGGQQPTGPQSRGGKRESTQQTLAERNGGKPPAGVMKLTVPEAQTEPKFKRIAGFAVPASAGVKKPGVIKTTAPDQDPIPRDVRPQVNVNGVDVNKRVTDPVVAKGPQGRGGRRGTAVAAVSLLKAGLVDPTVADNVIANNGGLLPPTPMDRIRGDKARERNRQHMGNDAFGRMRQRPESTNESRSFNQQIGRPATPSKSATASAKSQSGGSTKSTPQGYTRISDSAFVDSSGGVYYDRHISGGGSGGGKKR